MNERMHEKEIDKYIDNGGAPVAEEIGRGRSRPDKAADVVALVQCPPHNLPSQSPRGTHNQNASLANRGTGCVIFKHLRGSGSRSFTYLDHSSPSYSTSYSAAD